MPNKMNYIAIIDHYIEKCQQGFPIDKVRQELEQHNYNDEDIWFIVREVDNYLLAHKNTGIQKNYTKILKFAGLMLMGVGLILWFAEYAGLFGMGEYYYLPLMLLVLGAGLYYGLKWFSST